MLKGFPVSPGGKGGDWDLSDPRDGCSGAGCAIT